MRTISWRLMWLCVSLLAIPSLLNAQQGNDCKRIEQIPFTCIVGACQQTIRPNRCMNLTIDPYKCYGCWNTVLCCGQPVCSAGHSTFTCGGGDPLGTVTTAFLEQTKDWDAARIARVYVSSCEGGFVSLKYLLTRQATPQETPSVVHPTPPAGQKPSIYVAAGSGY